MAAERSDDERSRDERSRDERSRDERGDSEQGPSARQLLHWATGDRDAEAEALADDAGVEPEAAEAAVKRAHGDLGTDRSDTASASDVAGVGDARAEARRRR